MKYIMAFIVIINAIFIGISGNSFASDAQEIKNYPAGVITLEIKDGFEDQDKDVGKRIDYKIFECSNEGVPAPACVANIGELIIQKEKVEIAGSSASEAGKLFKGINNAQNLAQSLNNQDTAEKIPDDVSKNKIQDAIKVALETAFEMWKNEKDKATKVIIINCISSLNKAINAPSLINKLTELNGTKKIASEIKISADESSKTAMEEMNKLYAGNVANKDYFGADVTKQKRWLNLKTGDPIHIFITLPDKNCCENLNKLIDIKQTKLDLQLNLDLKIIAGAVARGIESYGIRGGPIPSQKPKQVIYVGYILEKDLDQVDLTLNAKKKGNATDKYDLTKEVTIVSGKEEHFFFSGDVPLSSAKQIKYDKESNSLQPKDTPEELYLTLNFQIGDIRSSYKCADMMIWERILDPFMIKIFMAKPTGVAFSPGVGLGYRIPDMTIPYIDLSLNGLSVFYGHFQVTEDQMAKYDAGTTWIDRWGLSFSVNTAKAWVK